MAKYNYKNDQEDKWYLYKGATPPMRTPNMTEEEVHEALQDALADHICEWKQQGNTITCSMGSMKHGRNVGANRFLMGTKQGAPILVSLDELRSMSSNA